MIEIKMLTYTMRRLKILRFLYRAVPVQVRPEAPQTKIIQNKIAPNPRQLWVSGVIYHRSLRDYGPDNPDPDAA